MNRFKLFKAGVNVNEALVRVGNDKALYEELLERFKVDERYGRLLAAMAAEDQEEAFQMGHALKGTAGNLGFTRFFDALVPLVESLRTGDLALAKASLPAVEEAYKALVEAI
ncbi:MAG: Hpt domain-containing protein [Phascolarctobacterium sp.]|nr:Hpt domain-containing protein [Phascolarctobacterium sp.]